MRDIIFKAKSSISKSWTFGYLVSSGTIRCRGIDVPIIKHTVCQYTGLKDKKNRKIFENDLTYFTWDYRKVLMRIKYKNGQFLMCPVGEYSFQVWDITLSPYNKDIEIVGSYFDDRGFIHD